MENNIENAKYDKNRRFRNNLVTYISKPENAILIILGVVLAFFTIMPLFTIVVDAFTIHVGTAEPFVSGLTPGSLSFSNWIDLFTGPLSTRNLWEPMRNTMLLSVFSSIFALVYGGLVAFLVTRTNMKAKKIYILCIYFFLYYAAMDTCTCLEKTYLLVKLLLGDQMVFSRTSLALKCQHGG